MKPNWRNPVTFGLLILAASHGLLLGEAAWNRTQDQVRFSLNDCFFNLGYEDMVGLDNGLILRTKSLYLPRGDASPASTVPLAFGLQGQDRRPRRAFVALEAEGPAQDAWRARLGPSNGWRAVIVRDVAADRDSLLARYPGGGVAVVPGEIWPVPNPDGMGFSLDVRIKQLMPDAEQRQLLADLGPHDPTGCTPHLRIDMAWGRAGIPYIADIAAISPVN